MDPERPAPATPRATSEAKAAAAAGATADSAPGASWWGSFRVPSGTAARWRIGLLSLWVQRLPGEWRIAHVVDGDPAAWGLEAELPASVPDLLAMSSVVRFAGAGDFDELRLEPLLADRPVVSRPEKPFRLLPGSETALYLSTPLWVRLATGPAPGVPLLELPLARPPDTWFGPSPREGELCYASRTFCRLHLEDVPFRPHRALTVVRVHNRADTPLHLERMKLPVVNLSLFRTPDGHLHTQEVAFERARGDDFAELRLRSRPPPLAAAAVLLAPPRVPPADNLATRAFAWL